MSLKESVAFIRVVFLDPQKAAFKMYFMERSGLLETIEVNWKCTQNEELN